MLGLAANRRKRLEVGTELLPQRWQINCLVNALVSYLKRRSRVLSTFNYLHAEQDLTIGSLVEKDFKYWKLMLEKFML